MANKEQAEPDKTREQNEDSAAADPFKGREAEIIRKTLQAGAVAKFKLYQTLIRRINQGDALGPNELKLVNIIEKELKAGDKGGEGEQPFKDRMKVLAHLKEQGYKIGRQKIYNDAGSGLLKLQDDGTVLTADVNKYIKRTGLKRLSEPGKKESAIDQFAMDRQRAELDKILEQVEEIKFKREVKQGQFIPMEDFSMELASRAAVLEAGLRHMIDSNLLEWVKDVGGDAKKVPALREAIHRDLDRQMNEYASLEQFHVIFTEDPSSPGGYDAASLEEGDDFGV